MTKRSWIVAVSVVVVVAIVALVVGLTSRGGGSATDPGASAPPSAPASIPAGSQSPLPSSTWTPEPAPTTSPKPRSPVPIESTATTPRGAAVSITKVASVTSTGSGPGDVVGPAIQVTVQIKTGDEALDLAQVVVNAYYGSGLKPALVASGPDVVPFEGTLAPNSTASGVFVFNVPTDQRDDVTIEVFYSGAEGQLRFRGKV